MTRSLLLSFVVVALVGCSAKDGKDGATGPAGATGPQGATGVMGPTGPAGPTGPQGPMGTPGTPGAAGTPGAPGQSGVVSMNAIAPNAATLPVATGTAFFGATVNVTTTAAQKVTGVITATGAEATGSTGIEVRFSLCARTQGATTAPVRFAASGPVLNTNLTELSSSFSAAESKVLGAGMWEVGLCAENMGADPVSGVTSGWVMVTN